MSIKQRIFQTEDRVPHAHIVANYSTLVYHCRCAGAIFGGACSKGPNGALVFANC